MARFLFCLLLVAPLVLYLSANPARIPQTVPRPPPRPPLRLRRDVDVAQFEVQALQAQNSLLREKREFKIPQPQRPQRSQPVPFPKPVPRPQPIPPLRLRRDAGVPQPQVVLNSHLPEHNPVSIKVVRPEGTHTTRDPNVPRPLVLPREDENHEPHDHHLRTPNPLLRMERSVKFPQPQRPQRPQPVPLPRPVDRPRPITPLRIRRDAPQTQDVKDSRPAKAPYSRDPNSPRPLVLPKEPQRFRRFVDGKNPIPIPNTSNNNPSGWELNPNISRDQRGNTKGSVDITHHGENGDIHGSWGQNLRGPDKHSETWSVGGSYRWPK